MSELASSTSVEDVEEADASLGLAPSEDLGHRTSRSRLDAFLHQNRHIISASTASVASLAVGYPADVLKLRMQVSQNGRLVNCFREVYRLEGARGFYRGILPPMVTVSFVKSVSFQIYSSTKELLISKLRLPQKLPFKDLTFVSAASGAVSGACISLISCPLELVKVQRQLEELLSRQGGKVEKGSSFRTFLRIVQTNGVTGLYRGLLPHTLRDTLGTATYFAAYEVARHCLLPFLPSSLAYFLAGGLSGVSSWLIIFPFDLLKSRLQKDAQLSVRTYSGLMDCARKTYATGGLRGFYSGFSATLLRSFPLHSLNWLVIEATLKFCTRPL
ncbi:mitochondrial carrier domain-containing protein [Hyaloraphidium curvatum]|nr:mitochondrial carrier domain-containing protein [Hyaloraphidium curvatum]